MATAKWPSGETEQVDVDVEGGEASARKAAEAELARDYDPGWKVVRVDGPMVGLY